MPDVNEPTPYIIMKLTDAKFMADVIEREGCGGVHVVPLLERIEAETGADMQDIATQLKKLQFCPACVIEGQQASCQCLKARRLGRRLQRLIDRAGAGAVANKTAGDGWRIPDHPTASNMRGNYLYLLRHIRDFKQDRLLYTALADDELARMLELEQAGLVRTGWFNRTNDDMIDTPKQYFLLTDTGNALLKGMF